MITDRYLLPEELESLIKICEAARPLWDVLTTPVRDGVSVEIEDFSLKVYDSNGDYFGVITWSDGGPAFYPDNGDDAKS